MKKNYQDVFDHYFEEVENEMGEFTMDDLPYGDTYVGSGEYLTNTDDVVDETLNRIKKNRCKIKRDYGIYPLVSFHCFKLEVV